MGPSSGGCTGKQAYRMEAVVAGKPRDLLLVPFADARVYRVWLLKPWPGRIARPRRLPFMHNERSPAQVSTLLFIIGSYPSVGVGSAGGVPGERGGRCSNPPS